MDEKNNVNEETGFVLQNPPEQQEDAGQAEDVQAQAEQTAGTEQQANVEQQGQPVYAETQEASYASPEQQEAGGPQPMPSSDNTYRFQNTEPKKQKEKKEKEKKEKKKWTGMPKVVVSAVVFGVVAAACFFGINALLGAVTGRSSSPSEIDNTADSNVAVTTVSGGAIGVSDVSGIVENVMPAIVAITEKSTQQSYFGQTYSSEGAGSGFIVKQDEDQLLIVTNNHVVADADKITVQFNDGESVDAEVKGTSESNDLAVLTVPLKSLKDSTKSSIKVAALGNSDEAKVGQMVIAIGNALGYGQSVTVGYISAKNREVSAQDTSGKTTTQVLMQTDAAINPGNSGGALIDTNGNVIGINSSKYFSYGNSTVEGMGYAIPMSDAVTVINELMNREVLKNEEKGYLGITGRTITETISETYGFPIGVYVAGVSDTGAAYKAGIKQGDVITKINGREVKTINEVQEIVNNTKAGTDITVTIKRSDDGEYKEKELKVTLKTKETLDGLESDSDSGTENNNNSQSYPNQGNGSDGSDNQILPW